MIYICEYDDSVSSEILNQYAEQLPIPNYSGPACGVKWQKYRERILAWMLFRHVIGSEKMNRLDIQRTKYGKPYSAAEPEFYFNISHCEYACACIISDAACGVDVEKKFEMKENLIRKICHPEEFEMLNRLLPKEREQQMRFLWSLKESYVKMDGRGLGYGLNSVNLAEMFPMQADKVEVQDNISYIAGEFERYTLAGCMRKQTEIPVHVFSETELFGIIGGKDIL